MGKKVRYVIAGGVVTALIVCAGNVARYFFRIQTEKRKQDEINKTVDEAIVQDTALPDNTGFNHAAWDALHAQNPDFMTWLQLDNGTMSLPVVQAKDNNAYLRHGFDKEYNVYGTPFLDAENTLSDDNLMIYGHSIDYGPQIMFTPLMNYTDQDTFNQNHTITIWWEDTKEQYSITNVYYLTERMLSSYSYAQLVFPTEESFIKWIEIPDQNNLIQAEQSAKYGDKLLTLQTCKPNTNAATKLIVIAKRISETEYE